MISLILVICRFVFLCPDIHCRMQSHVARTALWLRWRRFRWRHALVGVTMVIGAVLLLVLDITDVDE